MHNNVALIEKYRHCLPMASDTPIVSLGEGNTPLVQAVNMPQELEYPDLKLFFKLEGLNPTGSFKDRGMTLAISKALESKATAVICASTGNTSASAAAFATKAGLKCYVLLPAGQVAMGKVAQAVLYGAKLIMIDGNFDTALNLVKEVAEEDNLTIVNSINPYRLEGQKTAALEVVEQLGQSPDFLCIPVGNAGNISAYWRGFKLCHELGLSKTTPRMFGFQARGAAPIVNGHPVENPQTIATAIRIGNPASWKEALKAKTESHGLIDCVSDTEILEAYQLVARTEGIFCEPSSAAAIAGLIKQLKLGVIPPRSTVTCVLTGSGLKDPETPLKLSPSGLEPVEASLSKIREVMSL
jgi:threonine synthase